MIFIYLSSIFLRIPTEPLFSGVKSRVTGAERLLLSTWGLQGASTLKHLPEGQQCPLQVLTTHPPLFPHPPPLHLARMLSCHPPLQAQLVHKHWLHPLTLTSSWHGSLQMAVREWLSNIMKTGNMLSWSWIISTILTHLAKHQIPSWYFGYIIALPHT